MSIRSFSKFIGNTGCVVWVSVALAVLFLVSFLGFGGGGSNQQQNADQPVLVVTAFGQKITDSMIQSAFDQASQSLGAKGALTPAQVLKCYSAVFDNLITPSAALEVAQKNGVVISDQDLIDAFNGLMDLQKAQDKLQLMMANKLKPNASDADFNAAFKEATGKSYVDTAAGALVQFKASLKDPSKRSQTLIAFSKNIVPSKMAANMHPTADQLKATFVTLSAKRVFLTGDSASATAQKVEAEAKAGTDFSSLITKYTQDTSNLGVNPASQVLTVASHDLQTPPLNALLSVKPGGISDPISTEGGVAIYKVLAVKSNAPKDFDKNQAQYLTQYANSLGQAKYTSDLQSILHSAQLTWASTQFKALYDVIQAQSNPKADWTTLAAEAKASLTAKAQQAVGGDTAAALANYEAQGHLYALASPAQKKTLFQDRVESITQLNQSSPSSALLVEGAELFAANKDGNQAAQMLTQAMTINTDISPAGVQVYETVQGDLIKLLKDKLITEDVAAPVKAALASYQQNRAESLKQQAEFAAQQKEMEAQQAKDKAKYEAEAKAAAKANGTAGSTGSSASTAGGTATGKSTPGSMPLKGESIDPNGTTGAASGNATSGAAAGGAASGTGAGSATPGQ